MLAALVSTACSLLPNTAALRVDEVEQALLPIANVALDTGQLETAKRLYRRLLDVDEESYAARMGLGDVAFKDRRSEDAARWYLAAQVSATALPQLYDALLWHGRAALDAGQLAPARRSFERLATAREEAPTISVAWALNGIGLTLLLEGDLEGAAASMEQAVRKAPAEQMFADNLARALDMLAELRARAREDAERVQRVADGTGDVAESADAWPPPATPTVDRFEPTPVPLEPEMEPQPTPPEPEVEPEPTPPEPEVEPEPTPPEPEVEPEPTPPEPEVEPEPTPPEPEVEPAPTPPEVEPAPTPLEPGVEPTPFEPEVVEPEPPEPERTVPTPTAPEAAPPAVADQASADVGTEDSAEATAVADEDHERAVAESEAAELELIESDAEPDEPTSAQAELAAEVPDAEGQEPEARVDEAVPAITESADDEGQLPDGPDVALWPNVEVGYVMETEDGLFVQMGAFTERATADTVAYLLGDMTHEAVHVVHPQEGGDDVLYRVRIGPIESSVALADLAQSLAAEGYGRPRMLNGKDSAPQLDQDDEAPHELDGFIVQDGSGRFLQLGAFEVRMTANRLADKLRPLTDHDVAVAEVTQDGATMYRVRVGPIESDDSLDALAEVLAANGYEVD